MSANHVIYYYGTHNLHNYNQQVAMQGVEPVAHELSTSYSLSFLGLLCCICSDYSFSTLKVSEAQQPYVYMKQI